MLVQRQSGRYGLRLDQRSGGNGAPEIAVPRPEAPSGSPAASRK